ncbi:MAG: hypothetical protein PVJ27_06275 [Candidatus Brocadiaceae bacterium]|jgi:hypothetical protein
MWVETAISALSALFGGFVGGWVVAFRLGRWRQRVEDHLESIEARLCRGDRAMGSVPILNTRVDLILEELRAMKDELRQDRKNFVSHEECDRRHQSAEA